MNYKYIYNPHTEDVKVNFQGEIYTIGAQSTESFPGQVADQFVEIYGFMTYAEAPTKAKEVIKEEVKEVEEPKKVIPKKK